MAKKRPQDELLDHNFDGIQEYDNQLPGWWKNLFTVTIAFGVLYLLHFHVLGTGDTQEVEYLKEMDPNYSEQLVEAGGGIFATYQSPYLANEENLTPRVRAELKKISDVSFEQQMYRAMAKADEQQLAKLEQSFPEIYKQYLAGGPKPAAAAGASAMEPSITEPLTGASALAGGKQIFDTQCFTCHGKAGEGGIGPNMTDDYWIHGGSMPEIIHTIRKGVPAKGMISWERTLTPDQIDQVASYIQVKLVGTSPANPKAPEGKKAEVAPETEANEGTE